MTVSHIQKSSRIQIGSENESLTIPAPDSGRYNCLESITVESSAGSDMTITSGSKTFKVAIGPGSGWKEKF